MIFARSHTHAALACFFVLPAGAQSVQKPPSALEILSRTVRAHRRVGPATRTFTIHTTTRGQQDPIGTIGVQKLNDRKHYITTTWLSIDGMKMNPMTNYVNGTTQIWFDVTKQEYGREKKVRPDETAAIIEAIAASLAKPERRATLAKAKVEPVSFDHLPAWRLSWMESGPARSTQESTRVMLIVARGDALARKYTFASGNGDGGIVTWKYQHHKTPFPARTFVFMPPDRAKNVAE